MDVERNCHKARESNPQHQEQLERVSYRHFGRFMLEKDYSYLPYEHEHQVRLF